MGKGRAPGVGRAIVADHAHGQLVCQDFCGSGPACAHRDDQGSHEPGAWPEEWSPKLVRVHSSISTITPTKCKRWGERPPRAREMDKVVAQVSNLAVSPISNRQNVSVPRV